ncbi:hypothetical protein JCM19241_1907 [Vibrio ishigakensis]|uniref:Uncharacterized protein n=1 Tax=Vibrio ishigakensis TaxID=1481914 RepID=A0A0B8QK27_9VIBR|nr:hypothetical protein JCM19236_5107 [Vibrio sp. JCM 19236]GAM77437.1 hypothetical protein JCM19241_1907 [Vibrio ishigakensis]
MLVRLLEIKFKAELASGLAVIKTPCGFQDSNNVRKPEPLALPIRLIFKPQQLL